MKSLDEDYYLKDNQKYDRVTRILGCLQEEGLVEWKLRVGRKEAHRISTLTNKIGKNVDLAIRASFSNLPPVKLVGDGARNCFKAFLQWKQDYGITKATSGETIYDNRAMIAGTPDIELEDETLDIKCTGEIRPKFWLQTEWYARQKGNHFKSILRLDRDLGIYEYKKMPVSDYHWQVFEAEITLFRFYNEAPSQTGEEAV